MKIAHYLIPSFLLLSTLSGAAGCGRFVGHKHHDDDVAANESMPGQQCADLPHTGTAWKDKSSSDKEIADLRAKNCNIQADLLEAKEQTYAKQTALKAEFGSLSDPDTCLGKNKALTDFYPGALSSLQNDFDTCLDNAGKAVDGDTCLANFKAGGTRYLNLADKMAGCSGS